MNFNEIFGLINMCIHFLLCKSQQRSIFEHRSCLKPSEVKQTEMPFKTKNEMQCARMCKKLHCSAMLLSDDVAGGKTCVIIPEDQQPYPGAGCDDPDASVALWIATYNLKKCADVNRPEYKESQLSNIRSTYTGAIPGGLCEGRSITIVGTIRDAPGQNMHLTVALKPGTTTPVVAYLVAIRMSSNQIVYSWRSADSRWRDEATTKNALFSLDVQFEFKILVTASDFLFIVNNKIEYRLSHKVKPIESITHITVWVGNAEVSSLRFD